MSEETTTAPKGYELNFPRCTICGHGTIAHRMAPEVLGHAFTSETQPQAAPPTKRAVEGEVEFAPKSATSEALTLVDGPKAGDSEFLTEDRVREIVREEMERGCR